MVQDQISIKRDTLNALFPMHVILDQDGTIRDVGPTLEKILRRDVRGHKLFDVFDIKKPRSINDIKGLRAACGRKIVMSATLEQGEMVDFRSLATAIGHDGEELLIDFTFSADFVDLVQSLDLSSTDFKPNDFSLDMVYTIETQRTLVEDSNKLTMALEESRKEAEDAANIDVLTGIANRRSLYQALATKLGDDSDAIEGFLLHIDLDKFKSINDSFGHAAGDHVLQHTAAVLKGLAESGEIAARIGGDEFAMVVSGERSRAETLSLANKIQVKVMAPIEFEDHVFRVGVSIGIVSLRDRKISAPDKLFTCSDIALYEAKRSNRPVVVLTDEMLDRHHARATLIKEIAFGLETDQFVPFFQPKVDTRGRQISGIEVLARWHHPERGLIPPVAFIEVAESASLMGAIERSIMKKAIWAYKGWIEQGLQVGKLSFNLTATNLQSLSFVQSLRDELVCVGLSPDDIELELLESVIFERGDDSLLDRCKALRQAGFHLALDDFGTGYASISTLIDNPISTIKIDRSFISGINREERLQRITRSILALSKQLDLNVVAEGVECERELEVLAAFGCYVVQGYLFSRPVEANMLERWLRAWSQATLMAPNATRREA